jgi:hypothetical protein
LEKPALKGDKGDKGDKGEPGKNRGSSRMTKVTYIKSSISRIELNLREITDNHLAHLNAKMDVQNVEFGKQVDLVKTDVKDMKTFCTKVQEAKKYGLSGKDKAIVYGSVITAAGIVVVEFLRSFL